MKILMILVEIQIQGQATLLEAEGAVLTLIDLPLTGKGFPN
jgi:hypothetical protein